MMDMQNRKQLRLEHYDYTQNNAYFITICTYHRQNLFCAANKSDVGAHLCVRPCEANMLLEYWLDQLSNKFPTVVIDEYSIMPDHLHFILFNIAHDETDSHYPLPEIVKWFKTQTTNDYISNVKKGTLSPFDQRIWQRGYYEHIIRNDRDLFETRQYIRDNPLKLQYNAKR